MYTYDIHSQFYRCFFWFFQYDEDKKKEKKQKKNKTDVKCMCVCVCLLYIGGEYQAIIKNTTTADQ